MRDVPTSVRGLDSMLVDAAALLLGWLVGATLLTPGAGASVAVHGGVLVGGVVCPWFYRPLDDGITPPRRDS